MLRVHDLLSAVVIVTDVSGVGGFMVIDGLDSKAPCFSSIVVFGI
jgi:adenylate kinase